MSCSRDEAARAELAAVASRVPGRRLRTSSRTCGAEAGAGTACGCQGVRRAQAEARADQAADQLAERDGGSVSLAGDRETESGLQAKRGRGGLTTRPRH